VFAPWLNNTSVAMAGFILVVLAQAVRTVAICTCGESFNHLIQTSKKDNHVLIKHGV
jgi:protein-S-isoprenylcysteine O-methyltransferase